MVSRGWCPTHIQPFLKTGQTTSTRICYMSTQPNPNTPHSSSTRSHFQFLQPWWRCFKLLKTSPSIPKTFQKKDVFRFLIILPENSPSITKFIQKKKERYLQALTLTILSIPHVIHNLIPKEIPLSSATLLLSTHHRSISAADHYPSPISDLIHCRQIKNLHIILRL